MLAELPVLYVVPAKVKFNVVSLPILEVPVTPNVPVSPISFKVIFPVPEVLFISRLPKPIVPPIVPPIDTAPDPELISKSRLPLAGFIVEAKSTEPPPVVNVVAPANAVASLISMFPPFVVIFPSIVTPPEPSMVTFPIPAEPLTIIPSISTLPEPASRVTVVV